MKDHLRGSAKETTNTFTTGHSRKVTSFILIQTAMIISAGV